MSESKETMNKLAEEHRYNDERLGIIAVGKFKAGYEAALQYDPVVFEMKRFIEIMTTQDLNSKFTAIEIMEFYNKTIEELDK